MIKKFVFIFFLMLTSCIQELDLTEVGGAELPNILIVEATITDELGFQFVKLSKVDSLLDLETDTTFNPFAPGLDPDFDLSLVKHEQNASVKIFASTGEMFGFFEPTPGTYSSRQQFAAEENVDYQLQIITEDGRVFDSEMMRIEGKSSIENIYAEKTSFSDGSDAVGIFIDNNNISGNTGNLRFSYEETYKVIAPFWSPDEFVLTDYEPCSPPEERQVQYNLAIVPRTEEARVCFGFRAATEIMLNDKNSSADGSLSRYNVTNLGKDNFKITHRYSIEVKQFVTSADSYGFYQKLRNFSQNEDTFSQVQPGFPEGNIVAADGSLGAVIGFFDIASVSKKRLFFNFEDFFPGEELPDYPIPCFLNSVPEDHVSYCFTGMNMDMCPQSIIERVNLKNISYVALNSLNIGVCPGPYTFVSTPCGDCRLYGDNQVPDFWIE